MGPLMRRPRPHSKRVWTYIAFIVILAGAVVISLPPTKVRLPPVDLAILTILYIISEIIAVRMPRIGAISPSIVIRLPLVTIMPGRESVVLVGTAMMCSKLMRGQPIETIVFNGAVVSIASATCVTIMHWAGFGTSFVYPQAVPAFIMATTLNMLVNVVLVDVVIVLDNPGRIQEVWRSTLRSVLPAYLAMVPLALLAILVYQSPAGIVGIILFTFPLILAHLFLSVWVQLKESHLETVEALAAALEAKDSYSRGHSDRVGELAKRTAQVMRFRASMVEEVENGGRLHDIGKIGVPDLVLKKPSPLTPEELETMRRHVEIGAEIVKPLSFLRSVTGMVRYHHEWFGGGGYPGEMEGTSIPLGARVLAVCDAWDAMTSNRIYRRAMEPLEAWRRLVAGAGTQFDPEVVSAFKKVIAADKLVPLDVLEAEEVRIREERERESREEMMATDQLGQGLMEAAAGQEERGEGV
ncbi:MAG TPA: HD domain-containing protein [Firmicutes bacterium]|nr:HD domain-containing protein [Bacillota bacterium]